MNAFRYVISTKDLNFLNDVYDYLKTTSVGKCSDFETKYLNLLHKLEKIKQIQDKQRGIIK